MAPLRPKINPCRSDMVAPKHMICLFSLNIYSEGLQNLIVRTETGPTDSERGEGEIPSTPGCATGFSPGVFLSVGGRRWGQKCRRRCRRRGWFDVAEVTAEGRVSVAGGQTPGGQSDADARRKGHASEKGREAW